MSNATINYPAVAATALARRSPFHSRSPTPARSLAPLSLQPPCPLLPSVSPLLEPASRRSPLCLLQVRVQKTTTRSIRVQARYPALLPIARSRTRGNPRCARARADEERKFPSDYFTRGVAPHGPRLFSYRRSGYTPRGIDLPVIVDGGMTLYRDIARALRFSRVRESGADRGISTEGIACGSTVVARAVSTTRRRESETVLESAASEYPLR